LEDIAVRLTASAPKARSSSVCVVFLAKQSVDHGLRHTMYSQPTRGTDVNGIKCILRILDEGTVVLGMLVLTSL
jgi:hypothetical protein